MLDYARSIATGIQEICLGPSFKRKNLRMYERPKTVTEASTDTRTRPQTHEIAISMNFHESDHVTAILVERVVVSSVRMNNS